MTNVINIDIEKMKSAIDASLIILKDNFHLRQDNPRSGGWHQHIPCKRSAAVATAQVIACFSRSNHAIPEFDAALSEIEGQKIQGGFSITTVGNYPITESTAIMLISLAQISSNNKSKLDEIKKDCVNWLKQNVNNDNGWSPIKGDDSRTYATALSILALSGSLESEENKILIKKGIQWLRNAKNDDGGWGELSRDGKSTPFHTAISILAIRKSRSDEADSVLSSGFDYLERFELGNDMWDEDIHSNLAEKYDIRLPDGKFDRITWHHFVTPWVTLALLENQKQPISNKVFRSIKWIMDNQENDGSWMHKKENRKKTVWAIHDALWAIKEFESKLISIENYSTAKIIGNAIDLKSKITLHERLISTFFPISSFLVKRWLIVALAASIGITILIIYTGILTQRDALFTLVVPIILWILDQLMKRKQHGKE